MLHRAGGGNAEILALSNIWLVNIVVWRVTNQIARIESPVIHGSPGLRTLHLRWMDERHYEYTDIPSSYQPAISSQAADSASLPVRRMSGRVRRAHEPHDA